MEKVWTVNDVLNWTINRFKEKGIDSPRLDAELIISHALNLPRISLYTNFEKPLGKAELAGIREGIRKRTEGIPVAYITESKEFYGLHFYVDERVLIPRPETEILVENIILSYKKNQGFLKILEIGTGSGAISVALAKYLKCGVAITALDVSDDALFVAGKNAENNGVSGKIEFLRSDVYEKVSGRFDLIVSNPPYVALSEKPFLQAEVLSEPHQALFAGEDGLSVIKRIIGGGRGFLKEGGMLFLEIVESQGDVVSEILRKDGFTGISVLKDLAGKDRVVKAWNQAG